MNIPPLSESLIVIEKLPSKFQGDDSRPKDLKSNDKKSKFCRVEWSKQKMKHSDARRSSKESFRGCRKSVQVLENTRDPESDNRRPTNQNQSAKQKRRMERANYYTNRKYEIKEIVGKRFTKNGPEYLVKWLHYPDKWQSWERAKDFDNMEPIQIYEEQFRRGIAPKPTIFEDQKNGDQEEDHVTSTATFTEFSTDEAEICSTYTCSEIDSDFEPLSLEEHHPSREIEKILSVKRVAEQSEDLDVQVKYTNGEEESLPLRELVLNHYTLWFKYRQEHQEEIRLAERDRLYDSVSDIEKIDSDEEEDFILPEHLQDKIRINAIRGFATGETIGVKKRDGKSETIYASLDYVVVNWAKNRSKKDDKDLSRHCYWIPWDTIVEKYPEVAEKNKFDYDVFKLITMYERTGKHSGHTKEGALMLPDGRTVDLCDCLVVECPGCFPKCEKCNGIKCGNECRNKREGMILNTVDRVTNETIINPLLPIYMDYVLSRKMVDLNCED